MEKDLECRNVLSVELVAAYVRVSSQEQKLHGLSLDAQKMKLTEYAEKNNMKIVEWYMDEGVSGRKLIKNRPELQRMIQDAERGRFSRIIFIKLDRFFRSVAEYHECMKRISPVVWSTTEEQYDLTSANGRMLVNMKLTIAELEADQTGERIKIVNEYKVQTGQPLVGDSSHPLGFKNAVDPNTGRKKVVHDPDTEPIVHDLINHFLMHQSKRKTVKHICSKYKINMLYNAISNILTNTMLYGMYRGNPSYCEPYIDKVTFDKIQEILKRNVKENTTENRVYLFGGLIPCPNCGSPLVGGMSHHPSKGKVYKYKMYRCRNHRRNTWCHWNKSVNEKTLERLMLKNIEKYLEDAKVRSAQIADAETVNIPQHSIEDIHERIDRLNYSWQTGKIRTLEQYERQFEELQKLLEEAENEQTTVIVKDFSKVESILHSGWRDIYENLDDAHKKAFWRSFVKSIDVDWMTDKKAVAGVNFF